jgi:hypothetical protein
MADEVTFCGSGRLRPNYTEAYSLTVSADDHVRLWLDQQLLIDQWDRTQDFSYAQVRNLMYKLVCATLQIEPSAPSHHTANSPPCPSPFDPMSSCVQVNLTARRFHHLVLEYREMRESAHCRLWWSSPSTPFQVSRDFTLQSIARRLLCYPYYPSAASPI